MWNFFFLKVKVFNRLKHISKFWVLFVLILVANIIVVAFSVGFFNDIRNLQKIAPVNSLTQIRNQIQREINQLEKLAKPTDIFYPPEYTLAKLKREVEINNKFVAENGNHILKNLQTKHARLINLNLNENLRSNLPQHSRPKTYSTLSEKFVDFANWYKSHIYWNLQSRLSLTNTFPDLRETDPIYSFLLFFLKHAPSYNEDNEAFDFTIENNLLNSRISLEFNQKFEDYLFIWKIKNTYTAAQLRDLYIKLGGTVKGSSFAPDGDWPELSRDIWYPDQVYRVRGWEKIQHLFQKQLLRIFLAEIFPNDFDRDAAETMNWDQLSGVATDLFEKAYPHAQTINLISDPANYQFTFESSLADDYNRDYPKIYRWKVQFQVSEHPLTLSTNQFTYTKLTSRWSWVPRGWYETPSEEIFVLTSNNL